LQKGDITRERYYPLLRVTLRAFIALMACIHIAERRDVAFSVSIEIPNFTVSVDCFSAVNYVGSLTLGKYLESFHSEYCPRRQINSGRDWTFGWSSLELERGLERGVEKIVSPFTYTFIGRSLPIIFDPNVNTGFPHDLEDRL
jgi:hypothetical protein